MLHLHDRRPPLDADGYHLYLVSQSYTQDTIRGYLGVYALWERWCHDNAVEPGRASHKDVSRWLLERRRLSANTVRNGLIGLRSYYRYTASCGLRSGDPTAGFRLPKVSLPPVEPYPHEDIMAFVAAARTRRDRAILLLFLDTGLRCSELLRLRDQDINRRERIIRIHGKGGKYRLVAPGQTAWAALTTYLDSRADNVWQEGIATTSGLRSWLRRLAVRAGLERANLHRFRHGFACAFLENGGDSGSLQELLGHETPQMTEHYAAAVRRKVALDQQRRFSLADRL